jgi:hypothetical protein
MGQAARAAALRDFSEQTFVDRILCVYQTILNQAAGRR